MMVANRTTRDRRRQRSNDAGRPRLAVRDQTRRLSRDRFQIGRKVHLRSRNDNDFATKYPSIVEALAAIPDQAVLDGEIVTSRDGTAVLQRVAKLRIRQRPAVLLNL